MGSGRYFTFPLRLLWFTDPADKTKTIENVIDYSVFKFMESGECGDGNNEEKYKVAQKRLNFKGGTVTGCLKAGQNLIPKEKEVYTSVKTSYLFDARDNSLKLELLLLVAAIKSIIGSRNFTKTNRQFIIRRMYGRDHPMTRYRFDKLVSEAMTRRMLTIIPAGRGYYVSIRYTPEELKETVMQRITIHEGIRIEAAKAGKDIATLRKHYKSTYQQIPKTAP